MRPCRGRRSAAAAWKAVGRGELVCMYAKVWGARFCLTPRVTRQPHVALRSQDVYRYHCHLHKHPWSFIRLMARTQLLGALALLTADASLGGLSHGLGLVPRSQRSGLVKRRRVQAPATATDRIAQVTIGAYVAQVARPSLAALGARSTRLIL